MTYQDALKYLNTFINFEDKHLYDYKKSLKLDRMRKLCELIGDPQDHTESIHVAGSKGKGSTASIIYSILKEAGYKVGLYTSPHLVSFRERIRINDRLISQGELVSVIERVKGAIDQMAPDNLPTFFEVYTAIAFQYFKENKVDFAVYEVGLGGRLDATNVLKPLVSVITPLSYEHTDKLGNTMAEIAFEKAGIIKNMSICVAAPQEKEAIDVIRDVCRKRNSRLVIVGRDVQFKELGSDNTGIVFDITGLSRKYERLESKLLGSHQIINAAAAIGAIESLCLRGIVLDEGSIRRGVANARWDGRLEIASVKPLIVLDGAQNRASANVLAASIRKIFKYKRLVLVLGISKDKDVPGVLEELLPLADRTILTRSNVKDRALDPEKIKEHIKNDADITLTENVGQALEMARQGAEDDTLILVTGSLFVVGEAKALIEDVAQEAVSI